MIFQQGFYRANEDSCGSPPTSSQTFFQLGAAAEFAFDGHGGLGGQFRILEYRLAITATL
jgi:hypothetical protein